MIKCVPGSPIYLMPEATAQPYRYEADPQLLREPSSPLQELGPYHPAVIALAKSVRDELRARYGSRSLTEPICQQKNYVEELLRQHGCDVAETVRDIAKML